MSKRKKMWRPRPAPAQKEQSVENKASYKQPTLFGGLRQTGWQSMGAAGLLAIAIAVLQYVDPDVEFGKDLVLGMLAVLVSGWWLSSFILRNLTTRRKASRQQP